MTESPQSNDTSTLRDTTESERALGLRVIVFGDGFSSVHELELDVGEIVIGREAGCTIQIDHRSVSRRHAAIAIGPRLVVRDLGSSNGVEVDGVRLPRGGSADLRPGVRLRLGSVTVVAYVDRPAEPEAPESDLDIADPMAAVHDLCDRIAASDLSVLLLGETGVGKELVAERIHRRSARAGAPFVRLNAATVPEALAESQLFGHERGAFTGANHGREGVIAAANRGTLLLDEVGDLPPNIQTKLLRVLETGTMMRVGATVETRVDVRYLAATSRDVERLVAEGTLRPDLLFRLAGVTIYVPALRERPTAILPLARKLLRAASEGRASLARDAEEALVAHSWPGNVRELKTTMQRAAVLSGFGRVMLHHLALGALRLRAQAPVSTMPTLPPAPTAAPKLRDDVHAVERERILAALAACGGNQTRAAAMLGISRRTLGAKLDRFDYVRPRKKPT